MKAIHSPRFRNSEFLNFHTQVVSLCNSNNAAQLNITAQVNNLSNALGQLNAAFMRDRTSLRSRQLADLDGRRDTALVGLHMMAEANTHHFDAAIRQAGQVVLAAIDKYGKKLVKLNYAAETHVIRSIVQDLENAPGAGAIDLLSLNGWVTELRSANVAFDTVYLQRVDEYAAQPNGTTLELREMVTAKYRELCNYITSHSLVTPGAGYTLLVEQLDTLIEQYNNLLSTRRSGEEEKPGNLMPPQH